MILKEEEDSSNRESLVEEISPGYIIRKSDITQDGTNVYLLYLTYRCDLQRYDIRSLLKF